MNKQPKVSAQELITVVTSTNRAAGTAVRISGENSKSIAELTRKVDALQACVSQPRQPQEKPMSNGATVLTIFLMLIGVVITIGGFVPQITTRYLPFVTANAWHWIYIGYAVFTVLAAAVANLKTLVRVLAVLIAIAPMTISLILTIL